MAEPLYISGWSAESDRTAVVAESKDSVWLYLTEPGDDAPCLSCWLFNTPGAPGDPDVDAYVADGVPPPAPRESIEPQGVFAIPEGGHWELIWSSDGHAVAALLDDELLGVIGSTQQRVHARYLLRAGPWGEAWDDAGAAELFGVELLGAGAEGPDPAPDEG